MVTSNTDIPPMTKKPKTLTTPMTPQQYRDALEDLGWNQIQAARFFAVDTRTSRRWALGEVRIPVSVAQMLRFLMTHPDAAKSINPEVAKDIEDYHARQKASA